MTDRAQLPAIIPARLTMADVPARSGVLVRIWRRRLLFAAVFCSVLAIALLALFVLPTRYVASGTLIVAEQEPANTQDSSAWAQKIGDAADLESQLLLVRSPRIMRAAMASPGVADGARAECRADERVLLVRLAKSGGPSCDQLQPGSQKLLDHLEQRYSVGMMGRSRVISVSYLSPIPEVAQRMADALVNAFLDDQRRSMSSTRETAASYLWQEVSQLDTALKAQDADIQEFRRKNGLLRGSQAPIASEQLTAVSQSLATAEAARAEAAAHLKEIAAVGGKSAADAPAVLASRSVADLKQQLAVSSARLANASSTMGPSHPMLQSLQHEHDDLQRRMRDEVASIVASARKSYDDADALVQSLQTRMAEARAKASTATDAEATLANMVQQNELKRSQYVDLSRRASELETQRRVLIGNTRLVSLAELPEKPFFPRPIPFLAAGLTFAALLGIAAALLRDRADGSVRTASGLALATGVPVLARLTQVRKADCRSVIPLRNRGTGESLRLALRDGTQSPMLQDGLRTLFARLAQSAGDTRALRVLVTSDAPREGKTFTTLSLAKLMAASGRRVLLIEGDLRKPTFQAALDLDPGPGLASYLQGKATIGEVSTSTSLPSLTVIPAGEAVDQSTELLLNGRLPDLMRWTERFEFVLVDSPPASLLPDASILAKHVDGILVCTRWGQSQMGATQATVAALENTGTPVVGLAVTMVAPSQALYEGRYVANAYLGPKAA